ncbi:hypothetical protein LLEC1_01957 [Akanthomyces lecanii]|uniref:WSC domain-containing protein n=1 Tax=Cordyceps confragosa TaxID=2714763 RepID=A0A179IGQ3_CORDF|nr:hypothetical protein LLEC1_01957 [Akanthomyces lecanii]
MKIAALNALVTSLRLAVKKQVDFVQDWENHGPGGESESVTGSQWVAACHALERQIFSTPSCNMTAPQCMSACYIEGYALSDAGYGGECSCALSKRIQ